MNRPPWRLCLLAALCLWASTPPALLPGAGFLVLPGLGLWFAVATAPAGALRCTYALGVAHMFLFSWSLRHVTLGGVAAIALVGGLYYLAATCATRAFPRAAAVVFAAAVAGACWLRAGMPEIWYPHGQPCHALWRMPLLLGSVRLGGEVLANALLAWVAAAAVVAWRAWRLGAPPFRVAVRRAGAALAAAIVATVAGWLMPLPGAPANAPTTVAVAAVEPGLHPFEAFADIDPSDRHGFEVRLREILDQRFLGPTQRVAGRGVADPPDLVLWPENSVPFPLRERDGRLRFEGLEDLDCAPPVRVCLGTDRLQPEHRSTPSAVLVDARGRFVQHQEKRRLVPVGEFLPFLGLLPASLRDALREGIRKAMGSFPDLVPGADLPPLRTAADVPFSALVCYDNAFADAIAHEVAAGARLLAVLSDESWYRGGAECQQLAAITVVHALATATPFVRCTTDGLSMAVLGNGRIAVELEQRPAPQAEARILRASVTLGAGALPPMAWVHPWLGRAAAALLLLGAVRHLFRRRARLESHEPRPGVPTPETPGGGP